MFTVGEKHLYNIRLKELRQKIKRKKIDAFIVTGKANRTYLSGFTGSAGFLVVGSEKLLLVVDSRYTEQAKRQAPHAIIYPLKKSLSHTVNLITQKEGWEKLGFESEHIYYSAYRQLKDKVKSKLIPLEGIIENIRMIKDDYEIGIIKKAAKITDEALEEIKSYLVPGKKESDIAAELDYILKKNGGSGPSFDFIVASGERSSMPHGVASDKELKAGELITIDCGTIYNGYVSDITRTFFLGKPGDKHREVRDIVRKAQLASLKKIEAGAVAREVDRAAREVISEAGYGKYFGHGLGHGFGIEAHEYPRLSPKSKEKLAPGMMVTVEPGIYIPGWGGIRIEDMVLVKEKGYEILSTTPRNLLI